MIKLENMLLIGSTGRNTGKTTLACELLNKFGNIHDITAVKITTISEKNGKCPRGGQGCGVCSSLEGYFDITEETNPDTHKDTSKLLTAGAKKVYWMRVLRDYLEEGLKALLEVVGKKDLIICESNAVRNIVQPGVFIMTSRSDITKYKPSADKILPLADELAVIPNDNRDDLLNRIIPQGNRWTIKLAATAIILAGGTSGRMGQDKSFIPINGKPLIQHIYEQLEPFFENVIIGTNDQQKYEFLGAKIVRDKQVSKGPLMGIASTLEASQSDLNFVIACDIPDVKMRLVREMFKFTGDYDAVIPVDSVGNIEPLFAIYKKSLAPVMEKALLEGERKIRVIYDRCSVHYYRLDDNDKIVNLNWPTDYYNYKNEIKFRG